MAPYLPPPPEVAEHVYRMNLEITAQQKRLQGATLDEAWRIATDTSESHLLRSMAISILFRKKDPRTLDIVLSLFEEDNGHLWRSIIRSIHPDDPRLCQRLREKAQSLNVEDAALALMTLAKMGDESVLSICKDWLARSQDQRHAAMAALQILNSEEAHQLLQSRWNDPVATDEDRHVLAASLIEYDDENALRYTEAVAARADNVWSVMAATTLYCHRKSSGLTWMRHILTNGTVEAKQAMVGQISSLASGLPHEFTANGIDEAIGWLDQQHGFEK